MPRPARPVNWEEVSPKYWSHPSDTSPSTSETTFGPRMPIATSARAQRGSRSARATPAFLKPSGGLSGRPKNSAPRSHSVSASNRPAAPRQNRPRPTPGAQPSCARQQAAAGTSGPETKSPRRVRAAQFSAGGSAFSITRISTGSLRASSLSPSSRTAVKIEPPAPAAVGRESSLNSRLPSSKRILKS